MLRINGRTDHQEINAVFPVSPGNVKRQRTIDSLSHVCILASSSGASEDLRLLHMASAIRYTTNTVPVQERVNSVGKNCLTGNYSGLQGAVRVILNQMEEEDNCGSEEDDGLVSREEIARSMESSILSPFFGLAGSSTVPPTSGYMTPPRSLTPTGVPNVFSDISPVKEKKD